MQLQNSRVRENIRNTPRKKASHPIEEQQNDINSNGSQKTVR